MSCVQYPLEIGIGLFNKHHALGMLLFFLQEPNPMHGDLKTEHNIKTYMHGTQMSRGYFIMKSHWLPSAKVNTTLCALCETCRVEVAGAGSLGPKRFGVQAFLRVPFFGV